LWSQNRKKLEKKKTLKFPTVKVIDAFLHWRAATGEPPDPPGTPKPDGGPSLSRLQPHTPTLRPRLHTPVQYPYLTNHLHDSTKFVRPAFPARTNTSPSWRVTGYSASPSQPGSTVQQPELQASIRRAH
jgi:hypothetical protein